MPATIRATMFRLSLLLTLGASQALVLPSAMPSTPAARAGQARMASAFDKRVSGKMDVSYSVAGQLNAKPEAVATLKTALKAAEKELKSHPKAKSELGTYRFTDNIVGYGERAGGVVMIRFFGIFSKKNPNPVGGGAGTSYSCNISCTAKVDGSKASVTKLSCAKDEGWGRTIDVI